MTVSKLGTHICVLSAGTTSCSFVRLFCDVIETTMMKKRTPEKQFPNSPACVQSNIHLVFLFRTVMHMNYDKFLFFIVVPKLHGQLEF